MVRNAVASLTLVSIASLSTLYIAEDVPCEDTYLRLAGVWDPEIRAALSSLSANAAQTPSPKTLDRAIFAIDQYADEWSETHYQACQATHVFAEQSEVLLDLRMTCLNDHKLRLGAVVDLLRGNELQSRSLQLVRGLPKIGACSDRARLLAAFPEPDDPEKLKELRELRETVAIFEAEVAAGQGPKLIDKLQQTFDAVAELDYPPLNTDLLFLLGQSQQDAGDISASMQTFQEATVEATKAGDKQRVVAAWRKLAHLNTSFSGDLQEAKRSLRLAEAELSRIDKPDDRLRPDVISTKGNINLAERRLPEALRAFKEAVEIAKESELSNLHDYLFNVAATLRQTGNFDEALEWVGESNDRFVEQFGDEHPEVASFRWGQAAITADAGRYKEAVFLGQEAIAAEIHTYGSNHPGLVMKYSGVAAFLAALGETKKAHQELDHAFNIYQQRPDDIEWAMQASLYDVRGYVFWTENDYPAAKNAYLEAVQVAHDNGDSLREAISLRNLGSIAQNQGKRTDAISFCGRALEIANQHLYTHHEYSSFQECLAGVDP